MAQQPETPTLDRMQAPDPRHVGSDGPCRLIDHSNLVGSFIDWLHANGVVLAKRVDRAEVETDDGFEEAIDVLVPDGRTPFTLLHEYYGIDPEAEENERRALLEYVRASDAERESA